jgi:hypothetical protein
MAVPKLLRAAAELAVEGFAFYTGSAFSSDSLRRNYGFDIPPGCGKAFARRFYGLTGYTAKSFRC